MPVHTLKVKLVHLKIEKDILTKTISRLYQAESEFSKIQKDKLLLKYQHQLGIVLAKLEKLEQASQASRFGSSRGWFDYVNGSKIIKTR